jgi:hypothetical protein
VEGTLAYSSSVHEQVPSGMGLSREPVSLGEDPWQFVVAQIVVRIPPVVSAPMSPIFVQELP